MENNKIKFNDFKTRLAEAVKKMEAKVNEKIENADFSDIPAALLSLGFKEASNVNELENTAKQKIMAGPMNKYVWCLTVNDRNFYSPNRFLNAVVAKKNYDKFFDKIKDKNKDIENIQYSCVKMK